LVDNLLQRDDFFFCLLRRKESSVFHYFGSFGQAVMSFEKFELHDITGDEWSLVLLPTELAPVDVCEPWVLLDFSD